MRIETPDRAKELHTPEKSAAGHTVFAFDRDDTIDVNPPPWDERQGVPIEWVAFLAHRTDHLVYATGNQLLKREATIPGTAEIAAAHPDFGQEETDPSEQLYLSRKERVRMLGELYDNANQLIIVDDFDLSEMESWTHYFSWDFVPDAREGRIIPELPPEEEVGDKLDHFINPQVPGEY